jgi:hypothetical protein
MAYLSCSEQLLPKAGGWQGLQSSNSSDSSESCRIESEKFYDLPKVSMKSHLTISRFGVLIIPFQLHARPTHGRTFSTFFTRGARGAPEPAVDSRI